MSKHILVIDDEDYTRNLFEFAFDKSEFTVETASTVDEAIYQAENEKPGLVFLDQNMPGADVLDTLNQLRGFITDVPIYILTKYQNGDNKEIEDAISRGFDCKICEKPIAISNIQKIVNDVFTKKPLL